MDDLLDAIAPSRGFPPREKSYLRQMAELGPAHIALATLLRA